MIDSYVVYDSVGSILRSGSCVASDIPLQAAVNEWAMGGVGRDDTHWVDVSGPTIMEKTELSLAPDKSNIAADGSDVATISGIPAGVFVSLNGADPVEVTDGEVTFKTLDVGDHVLTFSGIKYLPQEVIIGAV